MVKFVIDWGATIRQHWRKGLYIIFYKLAEGRVLERVNNRIDDSWGAIASILVAIVGQLP